MHSISNQDRQYLLALARRVITHGVMRGERLQPDTGDCGVTLRQPGASFVTLYLQGQLAGCIGTLEASRPLVRDVAENAYSAAFNDPRFKALAEPGLDMLNIEIAVLSELQPLEVTDETELKARLEVDQHGVLIDLPGYRATFLPKVWRALPDKTDFIRQLKKKAGLSEDYWSRQIKCFLYTTESFSDV